MWDLVRRGSHWKETWKSLSQKQEGKPSVETDTGSDAFHGGGLYSCVLTFTIFFVKRNQDQLVRWK